METTLLFIAVLVAAVTDWLAVAKGWKKIETIAKPATMVLLFTYLALAGGFRSTPLICFGLGIFFSLAGDLFLMGLSDRWFLPGLVAFLLAHGSYIIGLNTPLTISSPLWAIGIGILLAITAGRVLRRILTGVREKGLQGLVVPVLHGAEKWGLAPLARQLEGLAQAARNGRLSLAQVSDGTFTLSNLGMFPVTQFAAIVPPPQVGILAVGRATERAVVVDGAIVIRTMMTATLAADHRAVDGAQAGRFLATFKDLVEDGPSARTSHV